MNAVKIGIAGIGSMGLNHCRVLSQIKTAQFIGVHDVDLDKMKMEAQRFGVQGFFKYEDLLDKVDAVIVAVPTSFHYELVKQAIQHHKHVFVEKPLVSSLEQAGELRDLLPLEKGLILQVGHIERFNPSVEQLYHVIDRSKLVFLETRRVGSVNRNLDVDVVLDLMIHDIDLVLDIVNSPIQRISVVSNSIHHREQPDIASVLLTFQNGVIANLTVSRISKDKNRSMIVTEVSRTIHLDFVRKELSINGELIQGDSPKQYRVESTLEKVFVPVSEPLYEELQHFIRCVQSGSRPKIGIDEAIQSLDAVMKIKQKIMENHID